jgi:hypothetical protein
MYGFFAPIFLLQAFCVYHAYRNNAEQRWYWLIVFFPLIGCVVYLLHIFNNRDTIDSITENVKGAVIKNYRIEQLEKAHRFSDNIKNKMNLADAYAETGRYKEAIDLYAACQQGFMSDDPGLKMKLLYAHFMNGDYQIANQFGAGLESESSFKYSEGRVIYAWSLFTVGQRDAAEATFADMNRSFTNYFHRVEYAKFLIETSRSESAREVLKDIMEEFDQMQPAERNHKRDVLRQIKDVYANNFKD